MKLYKVIKRESKKGINLKLIPEKVRLPYGWQAISGFLQAADIEKAGAGLKLIVYAGLFNSGLGRDQGKEGKG